MATTPDFFELYGMPRTLATEAGTLRKKYYELSRASHPDRFTNAPPEQQADALKMAALNNEAYKTLQSREALLPYVLRLHGVLEEEETYALPPGFLMEMMDLNEALDEGDTATAQQAYRTAMQEWDDTAAPLFQAYNEGAADDALLARLKDLHFRKKYLQRIGDRLAGHGDARVA